MPSRSRTRWTASSASRRSCARSTTKAAVIIAECLEVTRRLKLGRGATYILVTKAILYAHQGRRAVMEEALAGSRGLAANAASTELPYSYGLARTFCALLEENRELADSEMAQALAYDAQNPTTFHMAGKNGLGLLLGVLAKRNGWSHLEAVLGDRRQRDALEPAVRPAGRTPYCWAGTAGSTRPRPWSRRRWRPPRSTRWLSISGLRLVAEAAAADGWGEPVAWLRQAEDYFHHAEVPAVASACRSMLRQLGATVSQRRTGSDQVPAHLRQLGITTREFEVVQLLVDRIGNKSIASRLHISPRTVEKHVASLMTKTQQPDREALSSFARTVLQD